jgi:hypothetical protein
VDRHAADILQSQPGLEYVRPERRRVLAVGAYVFPAVTGQFMPRRDDPTHHRRMAFGDAAQGEERRVHTGGIELAEDPVRKICWKANYSATNAARSPAR